ncbi:hypothetical protein EG347_09510 [Chryseobacterium sp. G0186]|uniref:hypothetical protein n=1 Tax=Chryseobacterium sp. G0186 TaxID=2487064 RepID=UPI000F513586|nr:hypothetical protein [Chryseobacterium sp. G0186]AZA77739.1 hypothetical protein EG347_09510 [Chryseobacterium sp. G0186]
MTQAEILNMIDDELLMEDITTELNEQKIIWRDHLGIENSINIHQTAVNNDGTIAWWQYNELGKEQVRIKLKEKTVITWKPPITSLEQTLFRDGLLYFYENYLIIKYKDKHYQRLFIFNIKTFETEEIIINALTIQVKIAGNELFVAGLYSDEEFIKITMHPNRLERENIDEEYLNKRNIKFD